MSRGSVKAASITGPASACAALLLLLSCAAQAQQAQPWSLPPARPTAAAPAQQGPVDPQNPVVQPAPTAPAPVVTPAPAPTIDLPSPPPARRQDRAVRRVAPASPAPAATPAPTAAPTAAPTITPPPAPLPSPLTSTSTPTPTLPPSRAVAPVDAAAAPDPVLPWPVLPWWAWAAAALAAVAGLALLVQRRGNRHPSEDGGDETPDPAPPETPAVVPAPASAAAPAPSPSPSPSPAPSPAPSRVMAHREVTLQLEPVSLRLSLVYATLQCRVTLTAGQALPPGRLLGDMISAHASLPEADQLRPDPGLLEPIVDLPALDAGETRTVTADFRLPLNAVRAVHQGNGAFMVPLVRLALLAQTGNEPDDLAPDQIAIASAFTVGRPGKGKDQALALLRVDTGPRDHTLLAAREIGAARRSARLPLDPARAAV